MEWLWFGVVLAFALVMVVWLVFAVRTLQCHKCGTKATALAYQIGDTSPPIFQLVYRCPRCRAIVWKRYVNTMVNKQHAIQPRHSSEGADDSGKKRTVLKALPIDSSCGTVWKGKSGTGR